MDASGIREMRGIQDFSRSGIRLAAVDETVDKLCCTWGERCKTTRM